MKTMTLLLCAGLAAVAQPTLKPEAEAAPTATKAEAAKGPRPIPAERHKEIAKVQTTYLMLRADALTQEMSKEQAPPGATIGAIVSGYVEIIAKRDEAFRAYAKMIGELQKEFDAEGYNLNALELAWVKQPAATKPLAVRAEPKQQDEFEAAPAQVATGNNSANVANVSGDVRIVNGRPVGKQAKK